MSSPITPALKSSARSAYRALFRASGATFSGDNRVLYAFRDKVRAETSAGRQEVDPVEYEARVKHAFEVADVLKKNVVQAVKQGEEQDATWKLRMTPDIELGSNEGVKAPYSRPTRGDPRTKCGEDPNAVAPLPPRSLRHMAESNPTRSNPMDAATSSQLDPSPNSAKQVYEYDRLRVQSVHDRLYQVNRRVSASPTGGEFMTERTLVEDKLSALAARMEFLASEMHDRLYSSSPSSAPAQTLVGLLLDHLPISPKSTGDLAGPPVQLRQYVRYLQKAAKYVMDVRTEALSLSPEVRTALIGLVTTPSPHARSPNNAIENLRALQWRLLMFKRGVQGIVKSRMVPYFEAEAMADALRLAMQHIDNAHECIDDLARNGPRVEDARRLVEEMEKSMRGSYLLELRKEMETRLEAGVVDKKVEEAIISRGLSPDMTHLTRRVYRVLRQYEETLPKALKIITKAQEANNIGSAKAWCRKSSARSQKPLSAIGAHTKMFNDILDQLIALPHNRDAQVALLHEAKQALDLSTNMPDEYIVMLTRKAKRASWLEWTSVISSRLDLVRELVDRAMAADKCLEQYALGKSGFWEVDMDKKDLFLDARMELVILYDVAWRLERRMAQDEEGLRKISLLLCEQEQSEFKVPRAIPEEPKRFGTNLLPWKSEPKSSGPKDSSTAGPPNSVLIFDE